MSGLNYCSDYGSLSSSNSSSTWSNPDTWPQQTNVRHTRSSGQTSASFQDLVMGRCTLEDIMKEFQMNGSDSPYSPDEDRTWGNLTTGVCGSGGGGSGAYLRQKSWPAPDSSPAPPLPRSLFSASASASAPLDLTPTPTPTDFISTSTPIEESWSAPPLWEEWEEQLRVLSSLPNSALFALLHELEQSRDGHTRVKRLSTECRFCKNNGERECYYRSHSLKDGAGRVTCPVLRAFVCARCGASGDSAHTIKYCPLSTSDERMKSAAMLRSVRLASGRRRAAPPAPSTPAAGHYFIPGEPSASDVIDNPLHSYSVSSPLDPLWAALEQKLLS